MTENSLIEVINYILDKKFPGIVEEINVTKERDSQSYYIDDTKNYVYNIFIDIDDKFYDYRLGVVLLIENTLKSLGIYNRVAFYWN